MNVIEASASRPVLRNGEHHSLPVAARDEAAAVERLVGEEGGPLDGVGPTDVVDGNGPDAALPAAAGGGEVLTEQENSRTILPTYGVVAMRSLTSPIVWLRCRRRLRATRLGA